MFDPFPPSSVACDARIETVLALLNQRSEFARLGAEALFPRAEIAELLKLSGDPWTSALLAELIHARRRAESIAAQTPYGRVVTGLLSSAGSREASVRLMRRAVSRPIESAMLQAQDLLSRIRADKMPLSEAASERLDAELLGLQQAWTLYSERLLAAYVRLRETDAGPQAGASLDAKHVLEPAEVAASGCMGGADLAADDTPLWGRRSSDKGSVLH
ncbi:hypothetical protein [Roseateles sp.]|uniref:hypothetical protein n=1 Tax=Roseateles sp. TaxID=1971397 RepID=UPI003BA40FF0